MTNHSIGELTGLVSRVFENSRTSPGNARQVAEALVAAEADGLSSHGLSRVPGYADQAISGKVDGRAEPGITETAAAAARVDARSGFAYPAMNLGLGWAIERARETGIAAVSIGRSHHAGALGLQVENAAANGLLALAFTNSPAAIGPWGGNRALFGTNPIAFACPRGNADPLVVDLSMSKVARGRIKLAADRGEAIPEGWAVDADGNPTTDASAAMAGTMLPIGDAKGAALTLMVEILSATLTGSNHGFEASSFFSADGPPPHVGQLFFVIDAGALAGDGFAERAETLFAAILDQPGTRLPGERRLEKRARARSHGIDVGESLLVDLQKRAEGT